jgi:DNA-binding response OmpR family regulator
MANEYLFSKPMVVILEDDPDISQSLKDLYEMEEFLVVTANSAEEFKQVMSQTQPDLITMDILLSGADGREICRAVKNNPDTENIPVIMISALADAGRQMLSIGADDFFAKPFDVNELLERSRDFTTVKS